MTAVTMLEIRKDPIKVIRRVQSGQRMILTYRGKPVMRLEPIKAYSVPGSDAFYRLADWAVQGGASLTNRKMDSVIYDT